MIECKELAGKVVRSLTLYEEGNDGPEVSIDSKTVATSMSAWA